MNIFFTEHLRTRSKWQVNNEVGMEFVFCVRQTNLRASSIRYVLERTFQHKTNLREMLDPSAETSLAQKLKGHEKMFYLDILIWANSLMTKSITRSNILNGK